MKHWTEDELLQWIYGLREERLHLDECPECSARAREMWQRRGAAAGGEVSSEFLAAQRRNIYRRLEAGAQPLITAKWAVSLAGVFLMIVLCVSLLLPPRKSVPLSSPADAQLFSDLVSMDQNNEPKAIKPIHNLFE